MPHIRLAVAALLLATIAPRAASANDAPPSPDGSPGPVSPPWTLGLFTGAGYLGSPGTEGGAFLAGLRLGVERHFAASFDVGYGLLSEAPATQDRWWAIPSAALVIPAGRVLIDVGAGAGVGTSSGYLSWADYAARPFTPVWHYTVPAVRAHVGAALPLEKGLDLFARADLASLLVSGASLDPADSTWFALWIGVRTRTL